MTLLHIRNWHVWIARYPWAWLQADIGWGPHSLTVSICVLTLELGAEWVWHRSAVSKDSRGFTLSRVPYEWEL